jgi:CheY-like chemotaxis protein
MISSAPRIYQGHRLPGKCSATMLEMTEEKKSVAVLVDDMFFGAKINSAVEACGRKIERVKSREQLEALAATKPSLVILDLNSNRLDPIEAIQLLKSHSDLKFIPLVGFVSHVQTALIRNAQAAGCDYVLARSAFSQLLTEIVAGDFSSLAPK